MDSADIAVLVGGIVSIVGVLWFFFGQREEDTGAKSPTGPIYACPMHAWITSADPAANCSICGMKLVLEGKAEKSGLSALRE